MILYHTFPRFSFSLELKASEYWEKDGSHIPPQEQYTEDLIKEQLLIIVQDYLR